MKKLFVLALVAVVALAGGCRNGPALDFNLDAPGILTAGAKVTPCELPLTITDAAGLTEAPPPAK